MKEVIENFAEVTVSITMSKSIYLSVTNEMTKEELLEKAKKEIITPDKLINYFNITTKNVDLNDWNIDELEYITDYNPE